MGKREREESHEQPVKKHKHNHSSEHASKHESKHSHKDKSRKQDSNSSYEQAYKSLPASTSAKADIPAYTPFTVSSGLPVLPQLSAELAEAPFIHKSSTGYDRTSTVSDASYERLEFLGDAYLELIASRLIYHHFPHLTAGAQSQVRELLVKNETLAEYARAYGFEKRLNLLLYNKIVNDAAGRGNKGINKILGDSFEAYVAAAMLSNAEHGFAIVEKWLTALWAPKLLIGLKAHSHSTVDVTEKQGTDPLTTYSPTAKADLQYKILGPDIKLEYEPYRDSVELKGAQLGQNRHYIAVFLTGYGQTRKLLGKGEGKNKVEAGNWAATNAMYGEHRVLIEECTAKLAAQREAKKKAKEAANTTNAAKA